ncbi:hypothetical protein [Xanthomonas phage DES1]|nr:hypothetical protein [Xanthomonas phage DES1]
MRKKHKAILDELGAELVREIKRSDRNDAKAYIVLFEGKQYEWATSSVDRKIPPWAFSKKRQKKYIYGKNFYLYRMFDKNRKLLYIGKTNQLDYRLYAHFYKSREDWKDQVEYMDAHRFDKESDMHIYEMYLITKYKPVFNRHASCEDTPSFDLPELTFIELTDWD